VGVCMCVCMCDRVCECVCESFFFVCVCVCVCACVLHVRVRVCNAFFTSPIADGWRVAQHEIPRKTNFYPLADKVLNLARPLDIYLILSIGVTSKYEFPCFTIFSTFSRKSDAPDPQIPPRLIYLL